VITVLIASDIRLYREGLAASLSRHERLDVIGTAPRAEDAVRKAAGLSPSVVLVDHAMAESLRAIRLISESRPDVQAIVLGVLESDEQVVRRPRHTPVHA
jgi:DNA-binding NarL/FixJ family response regulator